VELSDGQVTEENSVHWSMKEKRLYMHRVYGKKTGNDADDDL
jgi:hypothetical protein